MQRNLATKIRAKRESGLTTVQLKQDPPVVLFLLCCVLLATCNWFVLCLWLNLMCNMYQSHEGNYT